MNKNQLLSKWLNNDITKEELEALKASPEHLSYIKIAQATSMMSPPEFQAETNFTAILRKKSQISDTSETRVVKLKPWKRVLKVAAVMAIVVTSYVFVSSLDTTITTEVAEKESFFLPDNSEVVLNANSEIHYNKNSWGENRNVSLEGEAYFKVAKGSTFKVKTPTGVVEVLGTQFNVFTRDQFFYIDCYEGLVSVTHNGNVIKLPAGEMLKIEGSEVVLHTQSTSKIPSWKSDESNFENATLAMVLKEIERQYPIKVTTKNIDVDKRFSGTFTHKDLILALKSICEPLNLVFTIDGKEDVTLYAKGS